MRASDNGQPPKASVATVIIQVTRNLKCPRWTNDRLTATILETLPLGEEIARVEAKDSDTQVCQLMYQS